MREPTANPTEKSVTVPRSQGKALEAHLALPEGDGPFPGVVVIHEISGLNDNIREIAGRFAGEGYAALAVDLFSTANRVSCMLRIFHGMLIRPLHNGVVGDLRESLDFLRRFPAVDKERVGAVGFCMGGTYALQLACVDEQLRASSVFYGLNPRPLEAVAQACPIIGSYPERDFTARAARQLEPVLEAHAIPHDIKIYPKASHSFFNDRGKAYDPEAAADAWARMMRFFEEHLNER